MKPDFLAPGQPGAATQVVARSTASRSAAESLRVAVFGLACLALTASGRSRDAEPLFQSDAALAVTLEAPWKDVLRKSREPQRQAATLSYADGQGALHRVAATIESRGLTRLRVCRFPPLRIRFAPGATKGTLFAGHRALKMVTHCQDRSPYEQYYVQEMLAYRIYNLVTVHSHRVRALDIVYRDTDGGRTDGPRFAFLVEELADVAARAGLEVAGEASFDPDDYDARQMTRFTLFQYLLGNTDWDVLRGPEPDACCHNVRVIGGNDPRTRIAVPYDFDSAGLVDANYAAPHARLPIRSVTQRLYRGLCVHNDALEPVRQEFLRHRPAILALVRNEPRLSQQRLWVMDAYIRAFYEVLENDARFAREISGKCRK